MSTTKKITIKCPKSGLCTITYPTESATKKAMNIIKQLNVMRYAIVPCDSVASKKTEKMVNISKYMTVTEQ